MKRDKRNYVAKKRIMNNCKIYYVLYFRLKVTSNRYSFFHSVWVCTTNIYFFKQKQCFRSISVTKERLETLRNTSCFTLFFFSNDLSHIWYKLARCQCVQDKCYYY